jgi:hypothetical protein
MKKEKPDHDLDQLGPSKLRSTSIEFFFFEVVLVLSWAKTRREPHSSNFPRAAAASASTPAAPANPLRRSPPAALAPPPLAAHPASSTPDAPTHPNPFRLRLRLYAGRTSPSAARRSQPTQPTQLPRRRTPSPTQSPPPIAARPPNPPSFFDAGRPHPPNPLHRLLDPPSRSTARASGRRPWTSSMASASTSPATVKFRSPLPDLNLLPIAHALSRAENLKGLPQLLHGQGDVLLRSCGWAWTQTTAHKETATWT